MVLLWFSDGMIQGDSADGLGRQETEDRRLGLRGLSVPAGNAWGNFIDL